MPLGHAAGTSGGGVRDQKGLRKDSMTAQDIGYHAGGDGQPGNTPAVDENVNESSANGSGYDPRLLLNSTQIPDVIIDRWMPTLSGGELRVVIYVARRTYGWRKPDDEISVSQLVDGITKRDGTRLDYGTGLSRSQVISAVESLSSKGVLSRRHNKRADGGDAPSTYSLDLSYRAPEPTPKKRTKYGANGNRRGGSENHTPQGGSENRTGGGTVSRPPGVRKSDPQQSVNQHPVSTTDRIDLPSVDQSEESENSGDKREQKGRDQERSIDRPNEGKSISGREESTKPWRKLAEQLKIMPVEEASKDELSMAAEIRDRLGIPVADATRLAQYCSSMESTDSLQNAVSATAASKYRHAWPTLLTAVINRLSDEEVQLRQKLAERNETDTVPEGIRGDVSDRRKEEAPEPDPEAEEIWTRVLEDISSHLNTPSLAVWFEGTVPTAIEGETLVLSVPNSVASEYIESRFKEPIEDSLKNELSGDADVRLVNYG